MSQFIQAVLPHLIPHLKKEKTSTLLTFLNEECAVENLRGLFDTCKRQLGVEAQQGDIRVILQHVMDEIDRRIPVPVG